MNQVAYFGSQRDAGESRVQGFVSIITKLYRKRGQIDEIPERIDIDSGILQQDEKLPDAVGAGKIPVQEREPGFESLLDRLLRVEAFKGSGFGI